MNRRTLLATFLVAFLASYKASNAQTIQLAPGPSHADNPLKGLVPYAKPTPGRFPHSMEFNY
ncbi:MAG: hypothetical protein MUC43_07410, partial [Pirellula sp.]|nr:hypothetical protein [Pirellula sp.]